MSRPLPHIPVVDAHAHFFSPGFIGGYAALGKDRFPPGDAIGGLMRLMGWEMNYADPVELGRRWVDEMDTRGIRRMLLITSWLWDEEATAKAVRAFPDRLAGYAMIDPTQPVAETRTRLAVESLGLKGITLFPAMHGYHASEPCVYSVYKAATQTGIPVFVHFGMLKVGIRDRLGLVSKFDLRFSNPLDLFPVAKDFPDTTFILPHFGSGYFQEMLMVAAQCPNVCVDSSSSNSWIKLMPYPLTLRDVFAKTLDVIGPERILFGSDSTAFPKGWRQEIFEAQAEALESLGCSEEDMARIFGGNAMRVFKLATGEV
ncbi:MAG: amidohydrolase family protein [candidate division Zixibacteria bacterium]|nr:amidohydrolase family protein [candidate division Zixibacteria bacterium]